MRSIADHRIVYRVTSIYMKARKVAYINSREKHKKSLWIALNGLIETSLETKSGQKKDLSTANASART